MNTLVPVIVLAITGMILQGLFIANDHKEKFVTAVILKGLASLAFVIIGALGYINFSGSSALSNTDPTQGLTKTVCLMICLGLLFGMLGDVFLGLRYIFDKARKALHLIGIALFFIGHIMYMIALIPMSVNLTACVIIGTVLAAIMLVIIYKTLEMPRVFQIFGGFYVEAVIVMTAIAIGNCFALNSTFRIWYAVGAFIFMLSDMTMIFYTFGKEKKYSMRIMNLSLYFIGQLLIASSLMFI